MTKLLNDQPIIRKAFLAPVVILLCMAVLIGQAWFALRHVRMDVGDLHEHALPQQAALLNMRDEMTLQHIRVFRFVSWVNNSGTGDVIDKLSKEVTAGASAITARFETFDRASLSSDQARKLDELKALWTVYAQDADKVREMAAMDAAMATMYLGQCDQDFVTLAQKSADLLHGEAASTLETARAIESLAGWQMVLLNVYAGVAVALGVVVAALTARSISTPIETITRTMATLSQDDLSVAIDGAGRGDEIGVMARALEVFKANLIEQRRIEREALETRRRLDEQRASAEHEAIEVERRLVRDTIGAALGRLVAKDLGFRLRDDLPAAYSQLKSDFNHAVDELESAMRTVSDCIEAISAGANEISNASNELSHRTEQQTEGLSETAAAIEEITAAGKKAASGASHACEIVSVATDEAEKASDVVQRTVKAMDDIDDSARKIGQIIGVIDEIAFQTNLLALNAGVEAARAGEAGRGFAVVASEVRALAVRSAEAAKEIKTLITTSSNQVAEGVKLVDATGKALAQMHDQVVEVKTVVVDISAGAREQASGLSEINNAINHMDHATQQNAAMVEETNALSHSLFEEVRRLTALVGQFHVGSGAAQPAANRVPSAPVKAAA